jgi:hypothetical protein
VAPKVELVELPQSAPRDVPLFRSLTAMNPLQFQKQLRLHEAEVTHKKKTGHTTAK